MEYEISMGFIPPAAVLNTAAGGSKKLTLLIFLRVPFEILNTMHFTTKAKISFLTKKR